MDDRWPENEFEHDTNEDEEAGEEAVAGSEGENDEVLVLEDRTFTRAEVISFPTECTVMTDDYRLPLSKPHTRTSMWNTIFSKRTSAC